MKRSTQLMGAVSSIALIALTASPALAAGTTAGTTITNNVSVDYQVGGVAQTQETASDSFTVDRKIDVVVAEVGGTSTSVAPGSTQQVTTFTVTNSSNQTIDLGLSAAQGTGDDFDTTNVQIAVDTNGNGTYDAGTDQIVTFLDEMTEDETRTVFVLGDIPIAQNSGDTADVILTATAQEGGTASSEGAVITATTGANTAGVDTVLADGAGDTDAANDGLFSDTDTYIVEAAELTVAKTSTIISDPVNGATDPKAIPGAVIEYCIVVTSAATSTANATAITINDDLPADVTYDSGFGIFVDGDASCANGSAGGTFTAGGGTGGLDLVNGTLSDISPNTARSLYFRVTID